MTTPATIVGPTAVVVVETSDDSFVAAVRRAVVAPQPLDEIIGELTGPGLRSVVSFGCVLREGAFARLFLRGHAVATITDPSGDTTLRAAGVATWAEHLLADAQTVTLRVGDPGPAVVIALNPATMPAVLDATAEDIESMEPETPIPSLERSPGTPASDPTTDASPPILGETIVHPDAEVMVASPESPSPVEREREFDFSHLLDETFFRSVEAAAVRPEQRSDALEVDPYSGAIAGTASFGRLPAPAPATPPPPRAAPPLSPIPGPSAGGLIDRVPTSQPLQPTSAPPNPVADQRGDHDGHTIAANLPRPSPSVPNRLAPQVQAVMCVAGHPNPPHGDRCRVCRAEIVDRTVRLVGRPSLGLVRFRDGMVVELDRPIIIGRRPSADADGAGGRDEPTLIAIPDPEKSLSRTHAAVRLQDWQVVVIDCGSTNHTVSQPPGRPPVQLRPDEPFVIVPGTTVSLGEVTSFVYEVPQV